MNYLFQNNAIHNPHICKKFTFKSQAVFQNIAKSCFSNTFIGRMSEKNLECLLLLQLKRTNNKRSREFRAPFLNKAPDNETISMLLFTKKTKPKWFS